MEPLVSDFDDPTVAKLYKIFKELGNMTADPFWCRNQKDMFVLVREAQRKVREIIGE